MTDIMTSTTTTETRNQIVRLVRDFVKREVEPVAAEHDREDTYPAELVESMKIKTTESSDKVRRCSRVPPKE